jgi:hypothetical protein
MIGLDIQGIGAMGAAIGFRLAGNAKVPVVLNLGVAEAGVLDPITDQMTPGEPVLEVPLEVLSYQTKEQQNISASQENLANATTTKTLLIEVAKLPPGAVIRETDTVTQEGETWGILSVMPDPSLATVTLVVRK